jgi:hypothetical protein
LIEPGALKDGFIIDNNPANMQAVQMMNLLKTQSMCMQTMMAGGLTTLGANTAPAIVPS